MSISERHWPWVYAAILGLVACLVFRHVPDLPFDADDREYLADAGKILQDPLYLFSDQKAFPGRPVVDLVFVLGVRLWGESPAPFHITLALLHVVCSIVVYHAVVRFGGTSLLGMLAGLLFLINVAHYRAVYWISCIAYPLALIFSYATLANVHSYVKQGRPRDLALSCASLLAGLLSHTAVVVTVPMSCLLALRYRTRDAWIGCLTIAAVGSSGAVWLLLHFSESPQLTALETMTPGGAADNLLRYSGRLLTRAHWAVPGFMHGPSTAEYFIGAAVLVGLATLAWLRGQMSGWALWTLLSLCPFVMVPDWMPSPSRYLYLATAGSSVILACAVLRIHGRVCQSLPRVSRQVALGVMVLLILVSSSRGLRAAVGLSYYTTAHANMVMGHYARAAPQFARSLELAESYLPSDVYWRYAASALHSQGVDFLVLDRAVLRQPDSHKIAAIRAIAHLTSESTAVVQQGVRTLRSLSSVLEEDPRSVGILAVVSFNAARGLLLREEYQGAELLSRVALGFRPDYDLALANLALALVNLGQFEEGLAVAQRAVAYPRVDRTYARHLTSLVRMRSLQGAESLLALAAVQQKGDDPEAARVSLARALQIDASNEAAWEAMTLLVSRMTSAAVQTSSSSPTTAPQRSDPEAPLRSAISSMGAGDYEQALWEFRHVYQRESQSWQAQYGIGVCRLALGDSAGAAAAFQVSRTLFP